MKLSKELGKMKPSDQPKESTTSEPEIRDSSTDTIRTKLSRELLEIQPASESETKKSSTETVKTKLSRELLDVKEPKEAEESPAKKSKKKVPSANAGKTKPTKETEKRPSAGPQDKEQSTGLDDLSPSTIQFGLKVKLTPVGTIISIATLIGLVTLLAASLAPELYQDIQHWFFDSFKYYLIYFVAIFFPLSIWLLLSRFGHVPLGKSTNNPKFKIIPWFAMVMAVGTGVELIFWGINEPIYHFEGNPFIDESLTNASAVTAMRITFYHWGFHPWSIIAIFGLCVAYATHRKGYGFRLRHTLSPMLGTRSKRHIGPIVDMLLVISTIMVVSTSLIFGTLQISKQFQNSVDPSILTFLQIFIIVLLTAIATYSSLTGIHRGIKILSITSLIATVMILLLMALFGPTDYLFTSFLHGIGDLLSNLVQLSVWVNDDQLDDWQKWWTLFYWSWWIVWAPFAGMFIAAISKGRSVREFLIGVVILPSLLLFLWHTLLGKTSLYLELAQALSPGGQSSVASLGYAGIIENVKINQSIAITSVIENLGFSDFAGLAIYLLMFVAVIYYVTCADSAIWVINKVLPIHRNQQSLINRLFWGTFIGVFSAIILVSGGFNFLQTFTILIALPISLFLLLMIFSFLTSITREKVKNVIVEP